MFFKLILMLSVFFCVTIHNFGPGDVSVCECSLVYVTATRVNFWGEEGSHIFLYPFNITFFAVVEKIFFST